MNTVQKERRKNIRYRVNKDVLSISKDILAEVIDISPSGMGCKCLRNSDIPLSQINEIDIMNCEVGTSVEGLQCKLVRSSEKTISDALTSTIIVDFGIEFIGASESQRKQLHKFIKENSLFETTTFA